MAGRNISMEARNERKREDEAISHQSCQKSHKNSRQFQEEENRKVVLELKEQQGQEIAEREERIKYRNRFAQHDQVPTALLQTISIDLKVKEDADERIDSEKKLHQHWRLSNPFAREHELNERERNLQAAWLDEQVEKQTAEDKKEKDMEEYLEERQQIMKEEKENEDKESLEPGEQEYYAIIHKHMQQLKAKDELSEMLRSEEAAVLQYREELKDIAREREIFTERKSIIKMDLNDIGFDRLKLQQRAEQVTEEIEQEQKFLERILKFKEEEKQAEGPVKEHIKQSVKNAINCLKKQQQLELEREETLGVLFDSDAKAEWQKQELIWTQEKKARNNFFQDILNELQCQIDQHVELKVNEQKELLIEKEQMLKEIRKYNEAMEKDANGVKPTEHCHDLDGQDFNHRVLQREKGLKKEYENKRDLEQIEADAEKILEDIRKIELKTKLDGERFRRQKFEW